MDELERKRLEQAALDSQNKVDGLLMKEAIRMQPVPPANDAGTKPSYMQDLKSRFAGTPLMANSLNAIQGVENSPEEQQETKESLNQLVEGAGGAVGSVEVKAGQAAKAAAQEAKPALESLRKAFTPQSEEAIASRVQRIGKMGAEMDKGREAQRIAATNKYVESKLPGDIGEGSKTFLQKLADKVRSPEDIRKLEELARNNPNSPQLHDAKFQGLVSRLKSRFAD